MQLDGMCLIKMQGARVYVTARPSACLLSYHADSLMLTKHYTMIHNAHSYLLDRLGTNENFFENLNKITTKPKITIAGKMLYSCHEGKILN